jgi:putative membrane protein
VKRFLQSWLLNTLAVLVAVYVLPGLRFADNSFWTPFVVALILGILNAFIRPIMMFLALPLLILTLGLFTLVINALLLYFVGWLLKGHFQVDSFGSAFLGAILISLVNMILNFLTGANRAKVRVHRRPPPPPRGNDGGPIIDI